MLYTLILEWILFSFDKCNQFQILNNCLTFSLLVKWVKIVIQIVSNFQKP